MCKLVVFYIYMCVCACVRACVCVCGCVCVVACVWFPSPFIVVRSIGAGRKEMFYLTTHSTHSIYGYRASDIW